MIAGVIGTLFEPMYPDSSVRYLVVLSEIPFADILTAIPSDPSGKSKIGNDFQRLFFPVRAVSYSSSKQCDPNYRDEFPELWNPNDLDIAKRDEFARLVQRCGGSLDVGKLSFICHRDLHPSRLKVVRCISPVKPILIFSLGYIVAMSAPRRRG